MKKNRYTAFKQHALTKSAVRKAFDEGVDELWLAVRFAELREKPGLTQTQLAAQISTSPAVISRIKNGGSAELKTLQKIARALQVQLKIDLVETG